LETHIARTFAALNATNEAILYAKSPEELYEKVCEAAGGYGERVEDPASLPAALERAMSIVKNERRQALLNVICGPGGTA